MNSRKKKLSDDAIAAYNQGLNVLIMLAKHREKDPVEFRDCYYKMGSVYWKSQNLDKAEEYFALAVAQDAQIEDVQKRNHFCSDMLKAVQQRKAQAIAAKAVKPSPGSAAAILSSLNADPPGDQKAVAADRAELGDEVSPQNPAAQALGLDAMPIISPDPESESESDSDYEHNPIFLSYLAKNRAEAKAMELAKKSNAKPGADLASEGSKDSDADDDEPGRCCAVL